MDILFGCLGFALGIALTIVASSLYNRKGSCATPFSLLAICGIAIAAIIMRGEYAAAALWIGALAGLAAMVMLTLAVVGAHVYLLKTDTTYRLKAALRRFGAIHGKD